LLLPYIKMNSRISDAKANLRAALFAKAQAKVHGVTTRGKAILKLIKDNAQRDLKAVEDGLIERCIDEVEYATQLIETPDKCRDTSSE